MNLSKFLEGKKTFIGLGITLFGVFGLTQYISPAETESALQAVFELVGIAIAVYGRAVAKGK